MQLKFSLPVLLSDLFLSYKFNLTLTEAAPPIDPQGESFQLNLYPSAVICGAGLDKFILSEMIWGVL